MTQPTEKRFGAIAVEKGFITKDQLVAALAIQARENVDEGRHRLIGQILVELGHLIPAQVEEILEAMSNYMLHAISIGR